MTLRKREKKNSSKKEAATGQVSKTGKTMLTGIPTEEVQNQRVAVRKSRRLKEWGGDLRPRGEEKKKKGY